MEPLPRSLRKIWGPPSREEVKAILEPVASKVGDTLMASLCSSTFSFWKTWLSWKMTGYLPLESATATLLSGMNAGPMTTLPGKRMRCTLPLARSQTPRACDWGSIWVKTTKRPSGDHAGDMASPGILVIWRRSRPVGLTSQTLESILPFFLTKASVERKKEPLPVRASSRSAQKRSATSGRSRELTLGYSLPKRRPPVLVSKARICTGRVPLSPSGQNVVTTMSDPAS